MDEPDLKNRESFKIGKVVFTRKDIADFSLIGSQYFQAMSVGIWLTLLQDNPKIPFWGIALGALLSFTLSLVFRWVSNKLVLRNIKNCVL